MDPSCSASVAAAAAAPPGLTVQVCFPAARAAVLDNLNRQREEGRLCDLSIQVQGQVFRAHRCVLAASSPYFHDQVLLKNVTTVSLPSVMDPLAFESVLSSAYTGQLSIVHDDIVNYVTVASFLQMWHIVDKCTEILKRSRPPVDAAATEAAAAAAAHSGTASRQQSPSSTDCLYMEREGRRRERRPDALPPLATWRRPQQFPRWGRQRAAAPQHSADSQLDAGGGGGAYGESEYAASEEVWGSGAPRAAHLAHEGAAHGGRQQGAQLNAEAARQRGRWQPRGAGPNDRSRESRESEEAPPPPLERKSERREIEADEGVGEQAEEDQKKKELSHCELGPVLSDEARMAVAGMKASAEEPRDKTPRDVTGSDLASELPGPSGGGGGGASRAPWQPGSWSQPDPRPPEGGACHGGGDEEEEVDFECLADGAFGRDTYDEIQDGTGQVSQRPLLPASPDFTLAGSEGSWPAPCGSPPAPRHLPPPSSSAAAFPPPPSPPTPSSSSSSVSLAGAPYAGKVHFCHCGKAYTLKSMRDRHVKMQHLNLRPFGCPVCTKSFKMKHHLTKHLKTHGGLRPYECSVCGKKVIWRDSFLRHQARCQRLAHNDAAGAGAGASASAAAAAANAEPEEGYGYAFEDGEAFLAMGGGAVKVEEADFGGEMGGLLGGMVEELAVPPQVFKEEASEGFGQS